MRNDTLFAATAVAVLLADRATKLLAAALLRESVPVIPGLLDLALVKNTGAGFGLLPGGRWLFLALAASVTAFILASHDEMRKDRLWAATGGLILGGGLGNAIDRLVSGSVTDFIAPSFFPAFNIADIALTFGGIGLVLALLRPRRGRYS
jgi:signal peptidase II